MGRDDALRNLIRGLVKVMLVLVGLVVVGWVLDILSGFPDRISVAWRLLGLVPLVIGVFLETTATRTLWTSGGGTPNPIDPPKRLVTQGPYRRSRNPLYLARLLMLVGAAVLLSSLGLVLLTGGLFLLLQFHVVPREENRLIVRYGTWYEDYRETVPRWLAIRPIGGARRQSPPTRD
jgi:protein-S-isoprenylcysteine O-methyltransferase Ste14